MPGTTGRTPRHTGMATATATTAPLSCHRSVSCKALTATNAGSPVTNSTTPLTTEQAG